MACCNNWNNGCGRNNWNNGCCGNNWNNGCGGNNWNNGCGRNNWNNGCGRNNWREGGRGPQFDRDRDFDHGFNHRRFEDAIVVDGNEVSRAQFVGNVPVYEVESCHCNCGCR